MDIYQIWTTYNKQWSRYEILAFMGVLILVCTAMAVCVHRKKLNIIQATAVIVLVVFLGIVFGSTVFTRIGTVRQYELAGSKTRNIFSESVANQDFMSRNIVVNPTSDLNDAESSVRADSLHHKANLITMCIKLNNRTFAVIFFTADI